MNTGNLNRRSMLKLGLGASALAVTGTGCSPAYNPEDSWERGDLAHMIPLVSHEALNLKVSFFSPLITPPLLRIAGDTVEGSRQDSRGRFWAFRVGGLRSHETYELQLVDDQDRPLCGVWPLATFPAPGAHAQALKIISFTCAGGPDLPVFPGNRDAFKPTAYRRRLCQDMLSRKPDLVVANGDHIYWDYRSWVANRDGALGRAAAKTFLSLWGGEFREDLPVLGTDNEEVLTKIADEQVARLYGVAFRSTPMVFVTDDHDYFENDDATPELVTFPPKRFNRELRNSLQQLYFPEYITAEDSERNLPGRLSKDGVNLSTHFGSVRYGDIFSGVYYDCGGMLSLGGREAGLIPPQVESWLVAATAREDTVHFAHFPSHPMGWTAGKWREWYPDLLQSSGTTLASVGADNEGNKYMWQEGWWLQHQRILQSIASQRRRSPLIVSGDLHLLGVGNIRRSGSRLFGDNPVHTVLSGPVGVGGLGWLSAARGVKAAVPRELEVEETFSPVERNGYTLLAFSRRECRIDLFAAPQGYVPPDQLKISRVSSSVIPTPITS